VAVDYQANIAAAARILAQKWNQLYKLGIKANGASSRYLEDWYFALWAYNSGLEPTGKANGNTTGCQPSPTCTDSGHDWGLGWADNPANSEYPPDRPAFLSSSKAKAPGGGTYTQAWDITHPQDWPYQEKVLGWAFHGYSNWSYLQQRDVQAFDPGSWPKGSSAPALAPHAQFCTSADHCNPADVPSTSVKDPANPCQLSGKLADHCWWHLPATWTDCTRHCGTGVFAYGPTAPDPGYPGVPRGYAPDCTRLPAPALVTADTTSSLPKPLGCGRSQDNGGVMTWLFGSAHGSSGTTYPSKIDFHQISAGFNGHFWFTHAISGTGSSHDCTTAKQASLAITGTWSAPRRLTGRVTIEVAIPNVGAVTPDAVYRIVTGTGREPVYKVINQNRGRDVWVSLGTFVLAKGAHVTLGNASCSGTGDDIAWDAVAFIPQHK
jgi:hypothetical protein